jgi:CheY-like chemotaxis protein/HPt (histidine-containing phosphotransfer) domain-containing protein
MNRRLLRRQLEREGAIVAEAEDAFDGFAALERAWHRGEPFDVAILDQMMPGMPGEALAERIRRHETLSGTPLVLLSSLGSPSRGDKASRVGFDAILTKPIRPQTISEALARIFGGSLERDAGDGAQGDGLAGGAQAVVPAGVSAMPGRCVLLAEDNKINQAVVMALLRKAGIEADVVENGEAAVAAVSDGRYDLVLMDVQMPVLDGLEAARRIRALPGPAGRVPILAMTAHAMRGDRERCIAAGMDDYLSKPIAPQSFLDAVGRMLEPKRDAAPPATLHPGSNGSGAPVVDRGRLGSLAASLPPADFSRLLSAWLSNAEDQVGRIADLAQGRDLQTVARLAHNLVGTAGTFGAQRLEAAAKRLEQSCAAADDDSALPPPGFEAAVAAVIAAAAATAVELRQAAPDPGRAAAALP